MLKNMRIAQRLMLLTGILLAMLVFMVVVGLLAVNTISLNVSADDNVDTPAIEALTQIDNAVTKATLMAKNRMVANSSAQSELDSTYTDEVDSGLAELAPLMTSELEKLYLQQLHDAWQHYQADARQGMTLAQQDADYQEVTKAIATLVANQYESIHAHDDVVEELTGRTVPLLLIVTLVVSVLVSGTIAWWLIQSITRPLSRLLTGVQQIGAGDLSHRIVNDSRDEIGQVTMAFNSMTDNLQRMVDSEKTSRQGLQRAVSEFMTFVERVSKGDLASRLTLNGKRGQAEENEDLQQLGENLNVMVESLNTITRQVRESVSGITSSAAQIQAATTEQIASTAEQDTAVTQTVATVEEVRTTVQQTAERAQAVADAALQSVEISRRGEEAVSATVEGMQLVRQRVENIAETILSLSERTQQIGEIINTVNAIADQSKLLALNASIEAARAGEEGRGFAVVAAEVRQLAEQSRQATARIGEILNEIQQATNTAVMVTEEGSKGAERGMELVNRAGEAIRDLASTLEEATQAAAQIAASTHQQTNGMNQLVAAMQQIKQASTQSAAGSRQTEQSARDLTDTSRLLEQAVSRYRLEA